MNKQFPDAQPTPQNETSCRTRIGVILAGLAAVAGLPIAAAAQTASGPCVSTGLTGVFRNSAGPAASASGAIDSFVAGIDAANTAFQSQSTAFIGSPPNPGPNQLGGGVWVRGIGGQSDFKSTATANSFTFAGVSSPGSVTCNIKTQTNFSGVQIGADIAQLNVDGWNLHGGSTLGYLGTYSDDFVSGGSFNETLQVPFVGIYGAVTKGGLFIDGQARWSYYQNRITDLSDGVFGQNIDARGFSVNGNIGYNFSLPRDWFIEPSAGILWSRVSVDPINGSGTFVSGEVAGPGSVFPGTIAINALYSTLGRVSVRVGTSFNTADWTLQPFATVSGFREFFGNNSANVSGDLVALGIPPFSGKLSSTNIGDYGQFGLGVVAILPNTGWLGYIRADYRTGDHIDGWGMNGGLRYQLSPGSPAVTGRSAEIAGTPVVPAAYNWTGFYLGPQLGADWGYTSWTFLDGSKSYPRFAGVLPGGQAGYNYQYDRWVFGIEGSGAWTNAHGARACPNNPFVPTTFFLTCEINTSSLYTVTGRIGFAYWDRVLWYGKGGLAIGEVTAQIRCNTDSQPFLGRPLLIPGCPVQGASRTDAGWTVGGGSELGLTDNWSVKAETSYFSLGSSRYALGPFSNLSTLSAADVRRDGWITTIGLNYRFTEAPAVIAKY